MEKLKIKNVPHNITNQNSQNIINSNPKHNFQNYSTNERFIFTNFVIRNYVSNDATHIKMSSIIKIKFLTFPTDKHFSSTIKINLTFQMDILQRTKYAFDNEQIFLTKKCL